MSIENEIKEIAAAIRGLSAAIAGLGKQAFTASENVAGSSATPAATEAKPEPKAEVKKGRGKAAKEEKVAPPADDLDLDLDLDSGDSADSELDLGDDLGLDEPEVTIKKEDLKATLTKLAKKNRDQAVGLMKRHGFKNFDEITEDKYAVIAKDAEKALAE